MHSEKRIPEEGDVIIYRPVLGNFGRGESIARVTLVEPCSSYPENISFEIKFESDQRKTWARIDECVIIDKEAYSKYLLTTSK